MRSWFRHRANTESVATEPDPDSPEALEAAHAELVRMINRNAGRLPVAAVVAARRVTDLVDDILESLADDQDPDIQAIVSVRGIVRDYLPTTLNRYLALQPDPEHAEQVTEQLDALALAADEVLTATRSRDADDLLTQGNFLRTKFSGSDLDL
ncbi:hypothetical protein [Nocardioides sp. Kera G14]|uniref:hypothetical protein n=1 Tax=Nocardioides sp. Kera G14 TaxID=2884264 RepID=UPI001D104627|nr:hypothetical protein [Nocardioides sp. Kera G14]UDY23240.1 hypothetical protein LH076_14400 [Nocardioides sp. Kera G14]